MTLFFYILYCAYMKWARKFIWVEMDLKIKSKVPVVINFQSKEIIDSFRFGTIYMNELNYKNVGIRGYP